MNHITIVAHQVVPAMLAAAEAHTRKVVLLILAALCLSVGAAVKAADVPARAQTGQIGLPPDLIKVQASEVPATVRTFFSLAHWPSWPPMVPSSVGDFPGMDLYLSASLGALLVDDRQAETLALMNAAEGPPAPGGTNDYGGYGGSGTNSYPEKDYSTNYTDLYLSILSTSNDMAHLILHNTSKSVAYEVVSSGSLTTPLANWTSEGIWLAESTNTSADIAIGSRTNQLFFDAHVWTGAFDHGVPANGQLFLLVNTNSIYPVINGVTNHLTPFYGNWVMLDPPLYCVNLGYDANDNGFTNSLVNTNPPQGVLELVGFSATLTNLCLSYNPLTNINVSGWPALQDLECWPGLL